MNEIRKNSHSPFLKHNNFICLQITEVNGIALQFDVRMSPQHQPTHVREEESSAQSNIHQQFDKICD